MNIAEIVAQKDSTLWIKAEDGRTGIFDVAPYLAAEAFEPLKDIKEFVKVRNGGYFVEWACGADLSADTILARLRTVRQGAVNQSSLLRTPLRTTEIMARSQPEPPTVSSEKGYSVASIRKQYNRAYAPWSSEDDDYLRRRFLEGASITDMVDEFGRQPGGIRSRLSKLGLL